MLNVIVLAGNVVADPKTRQTTSGKSVSTVRLAINNPMNDTEVLYIDVDVWDKQSEFVQKFVKKGNSVSTQGRLKSREWTDEKGTKRTSFSVVADRINFFGGKKKDDADKQHDENAVFSVKDAGGNTILQVNDPSKAKKAVVVSGDDKEPMDDIQF